MKARTRSNNVAARMGRWSASHKKTAIFGWLAFVAVAFMIGERDRHQAARPEQVGHRRVRTRRRRCSPTTSSRPRATRS